METTRCTAETLVFESDDCESFGNVHKAAGWVRVRSHLKSTTNPNSMSLERYHPETSHGASFGSSESASNPPGLWPSTSGPSAPSPSSASDGGVCTVRIGPWVTRP